MPSKWFLPLEFPIGVRQFCVIYRRFKALFCPELKGKVITNLKILALRLFSKSCLSSNRHLSSPVWIFFWNTKKDLVKRIQQQMSGCDSVNHISVKQCEIYLVHMVNINLVYTKLGAGGTADALKNFCGNDGKTKTLNWINWQLVFWRWLKTLQLHEKFHWKYYKNFVQNFAVGFVKII